MAERRGGDQVTEVTNTSWFRRVGQAIGGMLFGILTVIGAAALLFWNEGRAIRTAQGLSEGATVVRSIAADRVDPANDGKLVHVCGSLTAGAPIVDGDFALRTSSVRLNRHVEMYQWKEEAQTESRSKLGGGEERTTTYKYVRGWSDKPVDSTRFKEPRGHTNPVMPYGPREVVAAGVRLGTFAVSETLLRGFGEQRPLPATETQANALQIRIGKPVVVIDGVLHVGRDVVQPAIGDMRVSFFEVPLQVASIVAGQAGTALVPYSTRSGTSVELISAGSVPATTMFTAAQASNAMLTWILRAVGVVVMFFGFGLILRPLQVVADVVPLIGRIVGAGTGLVALLCTAATAPVVIAIGWLWYRPTVGVTVMIIGGATTYGLAMLIRHRGARKAPAPA